MSTKLNPDAIIDKSIEAIKLKESYLVASDNIIYNEEHIGYRRSADGKEIKNDTATIKNIYGNSVVWNQLATKSNVSVARDNSATESSKGFNIYELSDYLTLHNWYYVDITKNNVSGIESVLYGNIYSGNTEVYDSGIIIKCTTNSSKPSIRYTVSANTISSGTITPVIIDLTQMFGAGNEPTTVEEFYQRLPKGVDLNVYNEGEIVDGNYGAIKTTGFNQWDEQWEVGMLDTSTGDVLTDTNSWRSKRYIQVIGGEKYSLTMPEDMRNSGILLFEYDTNNVFIRASLMNMSNMGIYPFTRTLLQNTKFVHICYRESSIYNGGVCFNISDDTKNGTYEPYVESTCDLSWVNKYFPNGMCQAGTVSDEIRFNSATHKWEVVQRVGVVDLGSLTWVLMSNTSVNSLFYAGGVPNKSGINLLCSLYTAIDQKTALNNMGDKTVKTNSTKTGYVYIKDSTYTDATTFKTAVQGVMLNYELAEPIVTEITEAIDPTYTVSSFGTEELITDSQSSQLKANIAYDYDTMSLLRHINKKYTAKDHTHSYLTGTGTQSSATTRNLTNFPATKTLFTGGWTSAGGYATNYGTTLDISYSAWYQRLAFNTNGRIEYFRGINTDNSDKTSATLSKVGDLAYTSDIPTESIVSGWGFTKNTGNVTGPSSSTTNSIAIFDGTTGKVIKDSGLIHSKSGNVHTISTDTDIEEDLNIDAYDTIQLTSTNHASSLKVSDSIRIESYSSNLEVSNSITIDAENQVNITGDSKVNIVGNDGIELKNKTTITGNCYATAFYETSDENLKDFSGDVDVDFAKLKEIRKSYFTWKDNNNKTQIGTSAQDVQKVYPELVSEDNKGNLTVDYAKLSIVALSAIDKLDERLNKIEKALNIIE